MSISKNLRWFEWLMYISIAIHSITVFFEPGAWKGRLGVTVVALVLFQAIQAFYVLLTFGIARGRTPIWVQWLLLLFFVWGTVAAIRNFHTRYSEAPYWAIAHLSGFIVFGAALACLFFGRTRDWFKRSLRHSEGT